MNSRDSKHNDRAWQTLAAAAGGASEQVPGMPSGFVDKVMARLPRQRLLVAAAERERVVSVAACLTLAASLVLVLLSWNSIEAAWSSEPPVFERPEFDGVVPGFDAAGLDGPGLNGSGLGGAVEPWL